MRMYLVFSWTMLVHIEDIDQASLVRTMKAFSLNNDIFISSAIWQWKSRIFPNYVMTLLSLFIKTPVLPMRNIYSFIVYYE